MTTSQPIKVTTNNVEWNGCEVGNIAIQFIEIDTRSTIAYKLISAVQTQHRHTNNKKSIQFRWISIKIPEKGTKCLDDEFTLLSPYNIRFIHSNMSYHALKCTHGNIPRSFSSFSASPDDILRVLSVGLSLAWASAESSLTLSALVAVLSGTSNC